MSAICRKDMLLEWRSRDTVPPALVFALLVIVLFHYALAGEAASVRWPASGAANVTVDSAAAAGGVGGAAAPGVAAGAAARAAGPRTVAVVEGMAARPVAGSASWAAAALWVAFLFGSTLGLGRILTGGGATGELSILAITPADGGHLFLAKWLAGYATGLLVTAVLVPTAALLLGLESRAAGSLLGVMALALVGWSAAGTLIVALTAQSRARQALLPAVLFPVVLPLLITSLQASALLATVAVASAVAPIALIAAMDVVFLVLGFLLFPLALEFGG